MQGALPIATVYLTRDLVNRLVNAPLADLSATLTLVVLLALTLLLSQTLGGLNDWVRAAQSEWVKDHITDLIHAQAAALDLSFTTRPLTPTCCIGRGWTPSTAPIRLHRKSRRAFAKQFNVDSDGGRFVAVRFVDAVGVDRQHFARARRRALFHRAPTSMASENHFGSTPHTLLRLASHRS